MLEGFQCGLARVKDWLESMHFGILGALGGGSAFTTSLLVALFEAAEVIRVLPLSMSGRSTLTEGDTL